MARGPIPDKPRNRPTVPEAAEVLRAYYALPHRGLGGCVHIITEDGNTSQGHADACAATAEEWGREWGGGVHLDEDRHVAELLAAMTNTQRSKLARMRFYAF